MNDLAQEKSPYLRHAATQPVDWRPWSEEAFRAAEREDKPVFLSIGAAWCHWCHVMADECFEDGEIARLLNDNYICIKLDRDERPDIDRRFQRAAAAAGAGGGWPLTVFLTPVKEPFLVGTYFPREDAYGRPGLRRILPAVADLYRTRKGDIDRQARALAGALKPPAHRPSATGPELLDEGAGLILSQFDSKNGGFGTAPKFPMPGAIEFLMQRYAMTGNGVIANAVRQTLAAMARGGFHDQLGGGFHRYSTDESWSVPHFEKMADDNAWLLRNYTDGYVLFRDASFREAALGIVRFVRAVLSDPAGGFHASQDADVISRDEGGYFTWTDREIEGLLTAEEHRVLSLHFLDERGITHHDPSKRVLLIAMTPQEIGRRLSMEISTVDGLIASGRAKLLAARDRRTAPFVDTTLYTSLNGMLITSFLRAFRVFRDEEMKTFALRSLARIVHERLVNNTLFHAEGVEALLDDYASLTEACLEAYEVTGEPDHLALADRLMTQALGTFRDRDAGGFFDTGDEVLSARLKGFEDAPHPSANALMAMLLVRLSAILKRDAYRTYARETLAAMAAGARQYGVHGGYFFASLDAFHHLLTLDIEGHAEALNAKALALLKPYTAVVHHEGPGRVIPCSGAVCYEPIADVAGFDAFLDGKPYLRH